MNRLERKFSFFFFLQLEKEKHNKTENRRNQALHKKNKTSQSLGFNE